MRRLLPLLLMLLPSLAVAQPVDTSSLRQFFRFGACPPTAALCDNANEEGKLWVCTDGTRHVYVCSDFTAGWQTPPFVPNMARVLTVCPTAGECDYTVPCGATYSSLTATCAAGSALVDAAALSDPNNPVTVQVGPGIYDDVLVVEDTDLTIVAQGATFKPVGSTSGGVLRIGPNADGVTPTRVKVIGGVYHTNSWGAPEPACLVGAKSAGAGAGAVGLVELEDLTCIGRHDGYQQITDSTVISNVRMKDVIAISGQDACAFKEGHSDSTFSMLGGECLAWSNYCNPTGGVNYTSCGTGNDTTHVCITSGPASTVARGWTLVLTSCTNALANGTYMVTTNTTSLLTFTPAAGAATDAACLINLNTPNADESPCTDNWITTTNQNWKSAALHFNTAASGDYFFSGVRFATILNNNVANSGTKGGGALQALGPGTGEIHISNSDMLLEVNYDTLIDDTPSSGTTRLAGLLIEALPTGTLSVTDTHITVKNPGDPDLDIAGVRIPDTLAAGDNLALAGLTFDVSSTVGGYAGITRDVWFDDAQAGNVWLGDLSPVVSTSAIVGKQSSVASAYGAYPLVRGSGGPRIVSSSGPNAPVWSTNTTAFDGGDDMFCARVSLPDGTQPLANGCLSINTAVAATATSICVYSLDGTTLHLARESIDTTATGENCGALVTTNGLLPGEHYVCIGSDSAIQLKGAPAATYTSTVAMRNAAQTGAGATCPTSITPGSFSATTAMPEAMLTP